MWASYATKYQTQIRSMRNRGIKFTSPLIKAGPSGVIPESVRDFYASCGDGCGDPDSVQYIDVIAVNAFCGPWNIERDPRNPQKGCRNAAAFIVDEIRKIAPGAGGDLPVYITYWSRLYSITVLDQVPAILAMDEFFRKGSPVERVYWFGGNDFRERAFKNHLTDTLTIGPWKDMTLGKLWEKKCQALNRGVFQYPPVVPPVVPQVVPPVIPAVDKAKPVPVAVH